MDVEPVGWVRSSQLFPVTGVTDGIVRLRPYELDSGRFDESALLGLDAFSHIEVIFVFDQLDPQLIEYSARRPGDRADWPEVGIFAQRYSHRPNRIGITRCSLQGISGLTVSVTGLDAIEGTPVIDIKPWVSEYGPRGETFQPEWSTELMNGYW